MKPRSNSELPPRQKKSSPGRVGRDSSIAPLPVLVDAVYYGTNRAIGDRLAARGFPGIRAVHGKVFENLGGGATVSELAERAQVTKQSMADLVAPLERLGYLERVPHPTDRRAQLVRTTERGREAVVAAVQILGELVGSWRRAVGAARLEDSQRVLARIAEMLEKPGDGPDPD